MGNLQLLRNLVVTLLSLLLFSSSLAGNTLQKIDYSAQGEHRTLIRVHHQSPPNFEIFENLKSNILIVKLRDMELGSVPQYQVFDNPLVGGFQIQKIDEREYWIKIKTKVTDLRFKILPSKEQNSTLTIQIHRDISTIMAMTGPKIINMLRELHPTTERLIIYLDKPAQYEILESRKRKDDKQVRLRFLNTQLEKDLVIPSSSTKIIKYINFIKRGKYLFMEIDPHEHYLRVKKQDLTKPLRIILEIREDLKHEREAEKERTEKKRKEQEEKKKEEQKRTRFMETKFEEAESMFRHGEFERAALLFKNIYNFDSTSELGVRANFRYADSLFRNQTREKTRGEDQFVIQEYNNAIASALNADLGYDDIPRAYYNMGRSYLNLKFYEDAFSQFEIILKHYPESHYSKNSLLQQGIIHLNMLRYEKAIETLQKFVAENKNAPQIHEAYYKIGEAQFQLKQYKEARKHFDRAWSLNPDYMKRDPELMFHMGEAYFENHDYQTARSIYEDLIDRYPTESFSNLVAIRIGDFLRAEDKEDDAIKAYEKAIVTYTKDLLLVGKLRIANILSEKPEGTHYRKALSIYDEIIEQHPLAEQVEEAMIRKGLTLSLFQHYPSAVQSMEKFCAKYPNNIYVKNGIIHTRILETIQNYIKSYYNKGKYLDALGVYEQYEKKYYLRPQRSTCYRPPENLEFGSRQLVLLDKAPLFLIADSYFRLGLLDKALQFFDEILKNPKDPLIPLVLLNQGKVYDSKEIPERSQEIYAQFISKYPNHVYTPQVKKALGDSYFKVHKPDRIDRAIRIYNQTIKDYQDSDNMLEREIVPTCWFSLGNLYQGIGQYDNSIKAYKNVLTAYEHPLQDKQVAKYVVDTHFILGNLYLELNQLPEALKAYEEAMVLFPNSDQTPWAKYQKGQIFVKTGQKDKALGIFEELIEEAKEIVKKKPNEPPPLWGPLAEENRKAMVNDLKFDKYLNRTPDAKNQ